MTGPPESNFTKINETEFGNRDQTGNSNSSSYSFTFQNPGVYYYATETNLDLLQVLHNKIIVTDLKSSLRKVDVYMQTFLAFLPSLNRMQTVTSCCSTPEPSHEIIIGVNDCSNYSIPKSRSHQYVLYSVCSTPVVTALIPKQGVVGKTIFSIQGKGFSMTPNGNIVKFGPLLCITVNSTDKAINCIIEINDTSKPVPTAWTNHYLTLQVEENNKGFALVENFTQFDIQILPQITEVVPSFGSLEGGTDVVITGSTFTFASEITVGFPCRLASIEYNQILCTTLPREGNGEDKTYNISICIVRIGTKLCTRESGFSFTFSSDYTPKVSSVMAYLAIDSMSTSLILQGERFSNNMVNGNQVQIQNQNCTIAASNQTFIVCSFPALPASTYPFTLTVCNSSSNKCLGHAQIPVDFRNISIQGLLTKFFPSTGSIHGGTLVTLEGVGFHRGTFPLVLNITIGDSNCHVRSINYTSVTCLTSPQSAHIGGPQDVKVTVDGLNFLSNNITYTYLQEASPTVVTVSPNSGQLNDPINITGNYISGSFRNITVEIGQSICEVFAATENFITCNLGVNFAGNHPVSVRIQPYGFAHSTVIFEYQLRIYNMSVTEGSFAGGNKVTVYGAGFDPSSALILVCGKVCRQTSQLATDTRIECIIPSANITTDSYLSCNVELQSLRKSVTLQNGYNYSLHLTPTVDSINRTRGGTAGGSPIQITGNGFTNTAQVMIAGTNCTVVKQNDTAIHCITGASSRTVRNKVKVLIAGKGFAQTEVMFWYVDLWSSPFTWKNLTLPVEGDFVVVPKGQTLVLDLKTPILSLVLVQGGELIFDEEAKDHQVGLHTQRLLIVSNGRLEIGTEENPFLAKTEIVLYGHRRSTELPLFGTKNIALREGEITVIGRPINVTWSKLISTLSPGDTTLNLKDWVSWEIGGSIVIASTSYSQRENEVRGIKSIRSGPQGSILELTAALEYEHISVQQTVGGKAIDTSAEVGYLTRNILIRGNINEEWSESIQACSEEFRTGQFEVQTCFQGRFGSELRSDQFGGHIMIHAAVPSNNDVKAQLAYVEFTHVGQAFRLGRYPIHFHLSGNVSGSYVRGCAIHHTFNRAVTIHAVDYLLVENNVAYNILGHAYFFEDGNEQQNTVQGNLGVFVRASSSLLNVDITPATFWVVNPNNIIRNNAAAGGTHFGYWYRIPLNPTGPSFTSSMCPQKQRVLEFSDNSAHSFGWYGLWIFPEYTPTVSGSCGDNTHAPSYYDRLLAWKNDRGMEAAHSGSIQVRDSIMLDNKLAGIEYADMSSVWGESGPLIADTLIIGHSLISEDGICTEAGIKTPASYYLTVSNVTFVNFDQQNCCAILACSQCKPLQGGFETRYEKITYENVTNITQWNWEHEHIHRDMDGTLTRTGQPSLLVPTSGLLDPRRCTHHPESSFNIQGSICNGSVKFGRIGITNPTPSSLQFTDLNVTNKFGISKIPYVSKRIIGGPGYMALVEVNVSSDNGYLLTWIDGSFFTNISYRILTTGLSSNDYLIMIQNYPQPLDVFEVQGVSSARNLSSSDELPSASTGDYVLYNNKTSLSYVILGSQSTTFSTYKCVYNDCIVPSSPVVTPPSPPERSNNSLLWSVNSSWPNNLIPRDGQDCLLNGVYMQLDLARVVCNKLEIVGATLEVLDGSDHIIEATYIIILGGRLIAGYPETPFQSKLRIILHGNSNSPELRVGSSPLIGGRSIAVFGELILNASPRMGRTWTMLSTTASKGTLLISLMDSVDWLEGDRIVITSTSYDPYQSEVFTIKSVSANKKVLEVNDSLRYTHVGKDDALGYFGAEVGLLTRSIVIENGNPLVAVQQSFGCQTLVTQSFPNQGHVYLNGVEFSGCGHLGLTDDFNPRFALAFLNLQQPGTTSNVTECSFHSGYNTAIGVLNSNNILIKDNVIHGTVGPSMKLKGNGLQVTQNLASLAQYIGVFQKSQRVHDPTWTANYKIETSLTSDIVFEFNNAAGGAMACFHIDGEDCTRSSLVMRNNIGHSCLHGIHLGYTDGRPLKCSKFENFVIYSCYHYGFFSYSQASIEIDNLVFINNKAAVYVSVMGPQSLTHEVGDKYVEIKNTVVISTLNSTARCIINHSSNAVPPIVAYQQSAGILSPSGGHAGIIIPSFISGRGHFPEAPWNSIISYPTINGSTTVTNVSFVNFQRHCNSRKDVLFITNPSSEDVNHPVYTTRIRESGNTNGNLKIYIHPPKISRANPSDCVDMFCDGMKNVLLKDTDGTLAGLSSPRTIIPLAELDWDSSDRRAGIGDYRIPVEMLTNPDGSRISINSSYPLKGIVRGYSFGREDECSFMTEWNAYLCSQLNHLMLVMESLDADTEVRRLSPIGYGANGFVNLVNGPMDNGWCGGYTCQERISTFYLLLASGFNYTIALTSANPQNMGLHLLHADNNEVVTVAIIYNNPQRLDVHVSENGVDNYIIPNNAYMDGDNLKYRSGEAGLFVPSIADFHGSNFYDINAKILHITIRGKKTIKIITTPVIMLSLSVIVNDFYNEESLIGNLAFLLGIPSSKIRLVSVSRETSSNRKKRQVSSTASDTTVVFEIGDPPHLNFTNRTDFASLSSITEDVVNVVQAGLLNVTIASFSLSRPKAPPIDRTGGVRATPETGGPQPDQILAGSTIMTYYAEQLRREAEERMVDSYSENFSVPCQLENLNLVSSGIVEGLPLPLSAIPNVSMLNCDGSLSKRLGMSTPWMLSASADKKPESAFLINKDANFSEGHAYFQNLVYSHPGSYLLAFSVSYPNMSSIASQSSSEITVTERPLGLIIIQQPEPGNITFPLYPYIEVHLVDTSNNNLIVHSHTWRNTLWYVRAIVVGSNQAPVQVPLINGVGIFNNVQVYSAGNYHLEISTFQMYGSTVLESGKHKVLTTDFSVVTVPVLLFLYTYNINYQEIIRNKFNFLDVFNNEFSNQYSTLELINSTAENGNTGVIVSVYVTSRSRTSLIQAGDEINQGKNPVVSFVFNGITFTPVMVENVMLNSGSDNKLPIALSVTFGVLPILGIISSLILLSIYFYHHGAKQSKITQSRSRVRTLREKQ